MTSAHVATYGSFLGWDQGSAVSDTATHLHDLVRGLFRAAGNVRTFSWRASLFEDRLRVALDELVVDADQCGVSAAAVQWALLLAQSFPPNIPVPDVAIDPDGEIALSWIPTRTRMFSISVGDSDRVAYAWLDGSDHGHGVFRFTGVMPGPLLQQLTDLTADDDALVRAA